MIKFIKNKRFIVLIYILVGVMILTPNYVPDNAVKVFNNQEDDDFLKVEFQSLMNELFQLRNYAIITGNTDELQKFYDLSKNVTKWAYEQEVQKLNYLSQWEEKQGVKFNSITSFVKVNKVKQKGENLFVVTCAASTEYNYSYEDSSADENIFKLGTYHYINMRKDCNSYIITKEWYTDPFADSLEIKHNENNQIREYIRAKSYPINYTVDQRTLNAMDYAHNYCGLGEGELQFKYNNKYTNFNPQGGDCANFASQILYEGGKFKKNSIWDYSNGEGSKAWVNAQAFKNYMVNSGRASYIAKGSYDKVYKQSFNLRPGDFVAYEKKGKITHISTVTGLDSKGYPLVTCHNSDRLLVPFDLGWGNNNIIFHLIDVHY